MTNDGGPKHGSLSDSAPTVRDPYQKAVLTAKDTQTGAVLATLTVVAPVSTEMRCDNCHAQGRDPGGSYSRVELNILALHLRNPFSWSGVRWARQLYARAR